MPSPAVFKGTDKPPATDKYQVFMNALDAHTVLTVVPKGIRP